MRTDFKPVRNASPLGAYPTVTVVTGLTLALFISGVMGLLILHANQLLTVVKKNIEVKVFLQKDCGQTCYTSLETMLKNQPFLMQEEGKPVIHFVSKEEAAKKFIAETGEDFSKLLIENPLRDAYVFSVSDAYLNVAQMRNIKKQLEQAEGVFEVYYVENLVEAVSTNLTNITTFLGLFGLALIGTVVLMINNTVRLALYSQRYLISSMQLVGAKPAFIKAPFVKKAALQGLLASVFASCGIYSLLLYANSVIEGLESLQKPGQLVFLFAGILAGGLLIGWFSSTLAVNRFLKNSIKTQ